MVPGGHEQRAGGRAPLVDVDVRLAGAPPETFSVEVRRGGDVWLRADGVLSYDDGPSTLRWPVDIELPEEVRQALDRALGRWTTAPNDGR